MCKRRDFIMMKAPVTNKVVEIDRCIAPVIQHLWDHGFTTVACCCGHGRSLPRIVFMSRKTDPDLVRGYIAEVDSRTFKLFKHTIVEI